MRQKKTDPGKKGPCGCEKLRANNFIDMTDKQFDRLQVVGLVWIDKDNRAVWHCRCDCGNEVDVVGKSLRNGSTHSCGCLNVESATKRIVALNTKHGKTQTRFFRVWMSMKTRCENPNTTNFANYGVRGITICDEWKNDFEAFYDWAVSQGYDASAKRGKYTVDRIDNNKGYSPDNCRLANFVEQANNRRNTRFITVDGVKRSQAEWARYYGRHITIFQHMSDEEAANRIRAYEAYKREHNVSTLPRRIAL